ncbi:MAG: hypothetical protein Q7R81_05670 [Candidatus Peregrinibacteria bacterium]|nr:hypothetical protein [Candidatus Peregrinibacteria bacterium]
MTSLLFGIILSALLSLTSLLVILLRVSPLSAPGQALPSFFLSLFLSVSSVASLVLFVLWGILPLHAWDQGKLLSISLRQGTFIGLGTVILLLFHLLALLNWWIAILIYAVFVLVELALLY